MLNLRTKKDHRALANIAIQFSASLCHPLQIKLNPKDVSGRDRMKQNPEGPPPSCVRWSRHSVLDAFLDVVLLFFKIYIPFAHIGIAFDVRSLFSDGRRMRSAIGQIFCDF